MMHVATTSMSLASGENACQTIAKSSYFRVLSAYDVSVFHISEHFFKTRFPLEADSAGVTPQVRAVLARIEGEMTRQAIQDALGLGPTGSTFARLIWPSRWRRVSSKSPDKPQSRLQKYRLSAAGRRMRTRE